MTIMLPLESWILFFWLHIYRLCIGGEDMQKLFDDWRPNCLRKLHVNICQNNNRRKVNKQMSNVDKGEVHHWTRRRQCKYKKLLLYEPITSPTTQRSWFFCPIPIIARQILVSRASTSSVVLQPLRRDVGRTVEQLKPSGGPHKTNQSTKPIIYNFGMIFPAKSERRSS
jgi:hypothetical protein